MKTLIPLVAVAALLAATSAMPSNHAEEARPNDLPPLTSPGPYTDFLKQMQEKLHAAGFDAGPVNGDFGPETQAALAQFQLSQLLPASGGLDGKTLEALGMERPARSAD
jgi:peptidoglycan hydrolase-like protein with peptidoglycan-binding domain